MEHILQAILDVAGVSAALVFDGAGRLAAHRGHSMYDRGLCEQLSATLVKAIDTIRLQQEDWDTINARYADGRLLVRNLGDVEGQGYCLAVVATGALNSSFATVAIRVAANKLKKALAGAPGSASSTPAGLPSASASSGPPPLPGASRIPGSLSRSPEPGLSESASVLANSGVSWGQGSSGGLSRIAVADAASSAFLARSAKELAKYVGPMAKLYVEEAVRRVAPDAPFALAAASRLVEDLAAHVEDPEDRASLYQALGKP